MMNTDITPGVMVKNGTSLFMVLAVNDGNALLFRMKDGEVVVAAGIISNGTDDTGMVTCEWSSGEYYGSYMDETLKMLYGLRRKRESDPFYVKTSQQRAAFLETLGDTVYETPTEAFAENEAAFRLNRILEEEDITLTREEMKEAEKSAAADLCDYLLYDENAFNYDGMDETVRDAIKNAQKEDKNE